MVTDWFFDVDWGAVFAFETSPLEIFVRGTITYLALFVLLRLVLRREAGAVGITDLLVVVLIADAAQNAMSDDYRTIPDGMLLVATIAFWSSTLNRLSFHFPRLQRLIRPAPVPLVKDGRMLRKNMAQELITEEELLSQLRLQGASDVIQVESALMEGDGRISVIMRDDSGHSAPDRPQV